MGVNVINVHTKMYIIFGNEKFQTVFLCRLTTDAFDPPRQPIKLAKKFKYTDNKLSKHHNQSNKSGRSDEHIRIIDNRSYFLYR